MKNRKILTFRFWCDAHLWSIIIQNGIAAYIISQFLYLALEAIWFHANLGSAARVLLYPLAFGAISFIRGYIIMKINKMIEKDEITVKNKWIRKNLLGLPPNDGLVAIINGKEYRLF